MNGMSSDPPWNVLSAISYCRELGVKVNFAQSIGSIEWQIYLQIDQSCFAFKLEACSFADVNELSLLSQSSLDMAKHLLTLLAK